MRIVGGVPAVPYSWPAQVLIVQYFKGYVELSSVQYLITGTYQCGGTLINEDTVISAAHCVVKSFNYQGYPITNISTFYPTFESMFKIYIGVYNISQLNSSTAYQVNKVIQVI